MAKDKRRRRERYFIAMDGKFAESVTAQYMQGEIGFSGYKGAVVMELTNPGCCKSNPHRAAVFLYDDDFDNLIGTLRRAKRAWQKADREAAREHAQKGR